MKDLINQIVALKNNTNNLILKQDLNYDHLRNISNRLSHILSALKNMESSSRIIGLLETMIDKRSKIRAKGYIEDEWRAYQIICDEEKHLRHVKIMIENEDGRQ